MASDVRLTLNEDLISAGSVFLTADGYGSAGDDDFELSAMNDTEPDVMIHVHRDGGNVLCIELDRFKGLTEQAVKRLRDNPLPWTFTVPQMGIREKPLEDVLLAIWKKYRNAKTVGE